MEPANRDRVVVQSLRDIARARGLEMATFSHDWVIRLRSRSSTRFVLGYNFDLNTATGALLANDKSAAAEILAAAKVPVVPHHLFLHPRMAGYVASEGNWSRAMELAEQLAFDLVIKPNQGTGGAGVVRARNQRQLEAAFQQLHQGDHGLALSPRREIRNECRAIVLDDKILLAYYKVLPRVVGDGESSVLQLIARARARAEWSSRTASLALTDNSDEWLQRVPAAGETTTVLWQHNLARGAVPKPIDGAAKAIVASLAVAATDALGLRCAAVDVVESDCGWEVLEVNSGIMLESYARTAWDGAPTAAEVYEQIVGAMFGG